jgi:DNA-binding NtrC family response regulator
MATHHLDAESGDRRQWTVLIVDDDADMTALLRDALERDHRVFTATDAGRALDLVEIAQPDAVVIDKQMPGTSGLDLLMVLRRRFPAMRLILITAFGGRLVAGEARARGADHYLEKPFRLQELRGILRDERA